MSDKLIDYHDHLPENERDEIYREEENKRDEYDAYIADRRHTRLGALRRVFLRLFARDESGETNHNE